MRLRVGIILWLLSWVPYGLIFGVTDVWLTVIWTVQILLGLIGLALAGSEFAQAVKTKGWKGAPRVAWHALLHGSDVETVH